MSASEDGSRAGNAETVRGLFEEMPIMLAGLEGPEHTVVGMNAAYRAASGRADAVGLAVRELYPEVEGQQIFEMLDRVYASGEPQTAREWRLQIDRSGNGVPEDVYLSFTVSPRRGRDGSVTGLLVHALDVTERVRERQAAEAEAEEAQRRYEQARDVIDALQRELLPAGVPVPPGAEIAASYLLADEEGAAGGDWFDALVLADGRVALTVGDVVGHGVTASATMGQLRTVLRERLEATGDLVASLAALDKATAAIPQGRAATVCALLMDPVAGDLAYATAGHPPPLLITAAGETRYLPPTGAGPIGVGDEFTPQHLGTARLEPGGTVLLYSDGILERPGRELASASVELAQAAGDVVAGRALRDDGSLPAERVCTQTLELLTRPTGHSDDITLLAARRTDPPRPVRLTLTAADDGARQLSELRAVLAAWMTEAGASVKDGQALRHALVELATNSLEHGYAGRTDAGAVCEITGECHADGRFVGHVRDHGQWREPVPSPDRGLGLQIATTMVDTLRIDHDRSGTAVTVELALTRPARLLTADQLTAGRAAPRPPRAGLLLILDQPWAPAPRIRIDGPVDAGTAAQVEKALRDAGVAGARDLTVDLTGVSHLASAGVAALYRAVAAHRHGGTSLHLYAPAGCPADMILTLVDLGHLTRDPHPPARAGPGAG